MSNNTHIIDTLLSKLGKRLYFPKGIVYQTELAKNARIKATAGVAYQNSALAFLPEVQKNIPNIAPERAINYAPVAGIPELRAMWKQSLKDKNPSINLECISTPIVTSGLTHAISCALNIFVDAEDKPIMPNYYWENYEHIISTVLQAEIETYPMFSSQENTTIFNINGLEQLLIDRLEKKQKAILMFNFPNNPTGYSLYKDEVQALVQLLEKYAEKGLPILTIIDDAYFGLFYEDEIFQESIFALLSQLHSNILAIKIDGATKEMLAWGARVGFITFGSKGLSEEAFATLEEKIKAYIRSTVTSSSCLSQTIILEALQSDTLMNSIEIHKKDIKARFLKLQSLIIEYIQKFSNSPIIPLPCNSGYFLLFDCPSEDFATKLRTQILEQENIALISLGNNIRFTFSCVDEKDIEEIVRAIYIHAEKI